MRIFWHNFRENHFKAFKAVEKLLRKHGFHLVLKFDDKNVCHDAYIEKIDIPT